MGALVSLIAVGALCLIAYLGGSVVGLRPIFGVVIPALAFLVFVIGLILRVVRWARAPVPFRIPATCGQQKSLRWIRNEELDNPSTTLGVVGRMALEILFFRSLFRNTNAELTKEKERLQYIGTRFLWAAGMVFHWTMLVIVLRHFRFFMEPAPLWVPILQTLDGFFQVGVPVIYGTTVLFIVALLYLLLRRLFDPKVSYISLPADYFVLFLLLGIGISGALLRHVDKVDIVEAKAAIAGLASLWPTSPIHVGPLYFVHVFLVSILFCYFPFSKLLHMPGVFMSPTRNLANTNRSERHINPWNPDVKPHTYMEWQEEFKDKLVAAGFELDEPTKPDKTDEAKEPDKADKAKE
ncbi:sulfate reduction electron transfer complex DsrMKJOP subunit DsrM, partial [Planctomycetota bacterium]